MKDKEAAEAALKGQGLGLAKAVRKSLEAKTDEKKASLTRETTGWTAALA